MVSKVLIQYSSQNLNSHNINPTKPIEPIRKVDNSPTIPPRSAANLSWYRADNTTLQPPMIRAPVSLYPASDNPVSGVTEWRSYRARIVRSYCVRRRLHTRRALRFSFNVYFDMLRLLWYCVVSYTSVKLHLVIASYFNLFSLRIWIWSICSRWSLGTTLHSYRPLPTFFLKVSLQMVPSSAF